MVKLDVGMFIRETVPCLVYKSCLLEGIDVSFVDVRRVISGDMGSVGGRTAKLINNLHNAYVYAVKHVGYVVSMELLSSINSIICDQLCLVPGALRDSEVDSYGYKPPIPNVSEVESQLGGLTDIRDFETRAVVLFCYVVGDRIFKEFNFQTAMVACNLVLLSGMVGILNVPDEDVHYMCEVLNEYCFTDEPLELIPLLRRSIIALV